MHTAISPTHACATRTAMLPSPEPGANLGAINPDAANIDPVRWLHLRRTRERSIQRYVSAWRWGVVCGLVVGVPAGAVLCGLVVGVLGWGAP